jgi:hypothetical protein
VIATKAPACKLAKTAWHVMSKASDHDAERMFGKPATENEDLKLGARPMPSLFPFFHAGRKIPRA